MSKPSIKNHFSRVWRNLNRPRKMAFVLLLGLMIVSSFMEALSISAVLPFIGVLSDPERIFNHPKATFFIEWLNITSPSELLLPICVGFCGVIFFGITLRVILLYLQNKIGFATSGDFSNSIYLRTLYQPYAIHVTRNSSEVISGVTDKAYAILNFHISPLMNIVASAVTASAIIFTLFLINPMVAISTFFGFGTLYALIILLVKRGLANNSLVLSRESVNMIKALQEGLGGIRDVIIDGSQMVYATIYDKAQNKQNKALANNQIVSNTPRLVVELLGILFIAIIAYTLAVGGGGMETALPTLAALALGAQRLLPALQILYFNWTTLRTGQHSVEDGLQFLEQPFPEYANRGNPASLNFSHNIQLQDVYFKYHEDTPLVLNKLNLLLKKGGRYGFIGTTGCGKSTLLDIIMGLLSPTEGKLMVDGQEISAHNLRSWQLNIAHVPQAIYLSDATLAENIAFGVEPKKIDMLRVKEAAKKAQIAETIEALPEKYDTFVGERGIRLSGGQRQRIGIARALYKNAQVIVFDEATSALDNDTELAVMEGIEQLADDLTIIMVAHRISTLRRCDKIFRMDKGEVIEEGVYEEMVG